MELRNLLPVLAVIGSLAQAEPLGDAYPIDTFESQASLAQWKISGSASLRLGSGYRGLGAVLSYRTERGSPVAVTWIPISPLPKIQNSTVSLWVRSSEDVEISITVTDTVGRTLLLPAEPSLEHPEAGEWRYVSGTSKKRIAALAIIVRSRTEATLEGDLLFDEIYLTSAKNVLRLDPERVADADSRVKSLPVMGVNIHLLRDEASLDLAHAAGFRFVRMDLLWRNVERRGRFRFFPYDLLLRGLEARGMGVLWILDYGHPDHGGAVPRSPKT